MKNLMNLAEEIVERSEPKENKVQYFELVKKGNEIVVGEEFYESPLFTSDRRKLYIMTWEGRASIHNVLEQINDIKRMGCLNTL